MNHPHPYLHVTESYLVNPTNALTVNLIGAGGNGSVMLTALARMHQALQALEHPGLQVYVWDDDVVSEANIGRQLFAAAEIDYPKAAALTNRYNRFFGTNWKAIIKKFDEHTATDHPANITISCVDTVEAREGIGAVLKAQAQEYTRRFEQTRKPCYWLDLGNSRHSGQFVMGTVCPIKQPTLAGYLTVESLPTVLDLLGEQMKQIEKEDNTPSCSLAEALTKQDLFINPTLANMAASLLWSMLRNLKTEVQGGFLNLSTLSSNPVYIQAPAPE